MAITFSAAERLSITRRQIRIDLENSGFQKSADAFNGQQASLLQVDGGNAKFYDFYNAVCQAYENEIRQINGAIPDVYSAGDLTAAAETPSIPPFFPSSPPTAYIRNIPLIQDASFTNNKVKGYFHPTGTDARREQNILTNAVVFDGLTEMIFRLENGITGATPTTEVTTTPIPAGPQTGLVLTVTTTTGFLVGELVYIEKTGASGLYKITAIVPATSITVDSVIPSTTGIAASANIDNTVLAFTALERQNLTSALYQELLTNITNQISALITEWEGKIDQQISIIPTNQDDRTPQTSENAAALADVNNTKSIIDAWQALPNTGVGAKYTASAILTISNEITARTAFMSTRITQVTTALGGSSGAALTQSGDSYTTSVPNNPYFNRYKWLNFRINRASGSLRRYYAANQSKGAVQQLQADNTAIKAEYNGYFLTKAISFNDASDIIHVKDVTGLNPGDTITVVSETQPEITRTIVAVMGTTQLKLNAVVPITYKLEDIARIFKTL